MARSANHRGGGLPHGRTGPGGPWRAVVVRGLRYSAARVVVAGREGRRAVPERVVRSVAVYSLARSSARGGDVGRFAGVAERRARQVVRRELGLLRAGSVQDIEVEPGRHRHGARWLA
ncbi:hypothetical protein [Kitasatospora sp. NPDC094015]|uniref:hypothetical protein n=1 Tax=Kitasatospora sp. NPDC094015 TaxID=3155205 RepID=UPI003323F152